MKIENVLLENFGIYGGRRFRFDSQPLILIYGANESGKTTALNGLRQALFGFPHNSAYLTGKPMSAEATVTLADGRAVKFTRQKKRVDGFTAQVDGKIPLSEPQWQALTSGLDLKSYQSLFGFSLDELRSGEKALAYAPLDQALSSSGFGGLARLQQVQNRIDTFLNQTLKRVGVGGTINAKLAEIEVAEKRLESVLTLPADLGELRARLSAAQEKVDMLTSQMHELREWLVASQRQQAALPRAIEYRQVVESLRAHPIPAAIDEEFRMQWTVNSNRLAGARSELAVEQRKLSELHCALAALPAESEIGAHHEQTLQLGDKAPHITNLRRQVAEDEREVAELERELGESLRRLGWSRQDQQWRDIELDLNQQAELAGTRQTLDTLSHKLSDCHTRMDVAQKQLHMHSRPQTLAPLPHQLSELEESLRIARPIDQNYEHLAGRLRESQNDYGACVHAEKLLAATRALLADKSTADFELSDTWPIPAVAESAKHQQQLAAASAELSRLESELQQRQQACAQLAEKVKQMQVSEGLTSLADLESLWTRRDQLINEWREELQTPLLVSTTSPADHEKRLTLLQQWHAQSDTAVRNMFAAVDRVAALVSQQRQLSIMNQQCAALTQEVERSRRSLQHAQEAWKELWAGCPFVPASPEQMHVWLDQYRQWQTHQSRVDQLKEELASAAAQRFDAVNRLKVIWPATAGEWTTLAQAEQCLGGLRATEAANTAQHKLVTELQATYSGSQAQLKALESELSTCQAHYLHTTETFGLPSTWPVSEIGPRLDSLKRCQTAAVRVDKIRQRLHSAQQQIDQFAKAVDEHANRLGARERAESPEQQTRAWMDQLAQHQQAGKQRQELEKSIATYTQNCEKRRTQVTALEESLQQMVSAAGGSSLEEVQGWISLANTVFQLRARKAQLTAALETSAAGEPLEPFLSQLSTLNPRSVTAAAASLSAQLGSAEASVNAALQEQGALTRELEYKEQGSAAMECEQELKRLRAELIDLSEQWVVHRLAGELLSRTIDRFTRDHEPQLLKHTRRFFKELTDSRYCVVEHDSGKHGGFAVRDQQGHAWQPDKLSTGTREQLYLAIRLAFITHFNEQHEPLPVIMDDCFVNFDDTRARIALKTLINWRESVQTILLSCHWRSVEALAEQAPETPVITVASGEMTTARQLVDRADEHLSVNVLRSPMKLA